MLYHIGIEVIYLNKKQFSVEIKLFFIDWMKNSFEMLETGMEDK